MNYVSCSLGLRLVFLRFTTRIPMSCEKVRGSCEKVRGSCEKVRGSCDIASMVQHVSKKNHWFCVWCVLKYRNLLCTDSFKAFATQMMLPEWFGSMPENLHFTTDNLSEYSGYFTENLFTCWNNEDYEIYKKRYNKNKWGKNLCRTFKNLCERMNAEL